MPPPSSWSGCGNRRELLVRLDRARLAQNLPALDLVLADAAKQTPDIVASLALVEQFRNISTPVTTDFLVSRRPTISTSSPTLILPRSVGPSPPCHGPRSRTRPRSASGTAGRSAAPAAARSCRSPHATAARTSANSPFAVERLDRRAADHRRGVARNWYFEAVSAPPARPGPQFRIVDRSTLLSNTMNGTRPGAPAKCARGSRHRARRPTPLNRPVHLRRAGDHVLH